QAHENLGHRGIDATFHTINMRFFWPHMRLHIRSHVKSCHQCQLHSHQHVEIPLQPSTPVTIFQKVYVDVMFMPKARGFRYIVAARDDLSGFCEARALKKNNAKALAKF
ncbi:hypothetical protein K435DRAFT_578369, partial [Dendrothele bispora CBS 962.96]